MADLKYWIWLAGTGIKTKTTLQLVEYFQNPENVYFAHATEYDELPGLPVREKTLLANKSLRRTYQIMGDCEQKGIRIVSMQNPEYPNRLKAIYDPPIVLYIRGKQISIDEEAAIGIVGSRVCTPYGELVAGRFAYQFSKHGALIVSGIAEGIDAAAVHGALKAGGSVISVTGGGVDFIYPRINRDLYRDVPSAGALISEYPPGTRPLGRHFPIRNRIISGLSLGVVIVEAAEHSGSLITANHALEQGRDVFAVPGNLYSPKSKGTNRLIRDSAAQLVTCAWDVLREYASAYPYKIKENPEMKSWSESGDLAPGTGPKEAAPAALQPEDRKKIVDKSERRAYIDLRERGETFSDDEAVLLDILNESPLYTDQIIERSQLSTARVLSTLTVLEIRELIIQLDDKRYASQIQM